ncbi:probable serpin E3 [Corythoichthys intestinalis]|uniref:probable serpin E3 n=1 Tax=Corythoichthys intestinalis TaxID=161448 RepID=UPI0025A52C9C|nr:probable serpin E3 [Corythoichthys intestinalis]XP_061799645.1 probable serpin E3 [Nerophis lumbriciformis]
MCCLPVAAIVALLCLASPIHSTSSPQAGLRHRQGSFAVALYRAIAASRANANLVVSPSGTATALGLLQLGARGDTRAQLVAGLGYDVNDVQVRELLLQWQAEMNNSSSPKASKEAGLQHTCVLLVQSGIKLAAGFRQNVEAWADVSVMRDNQQQSNNTRRDEVWLPIQAGSSSGDLSGSGEVQQAEASASLALWSPGQQMALLSTVAFRGVWQKQFHAINTHNLHFLLLDGTTVKVPMMHQAAEVRFGQFQMPSSQRYSVLDLPYSGQSLSLQVVLPWDRKTPLSSLEAQLSYRHVASWDVGLRRTKMDVFLPRFKLHNKLNLRSTLPTMGIGDAFNPTDADFSGMSAEDSLYVSDAFHDVTIEVTEEGTKAAAATTMMLLKRSRSPVFKADRPFLFLVRHVKTGSILFMGRLMNPTDQSL